jgi:hypothetical protein
MTCLFRSYPQFLRANSYKYAMVASCPITYAADSYEIVQRRTVKDFFPKWKYRHKSFRYISNVFTLLPNVTSQILIFTQVFHYYCYHHHHHHHHHHRHLQHFYWHRFHVPVTFNPLPNKLYLDSSFFLSFLGGKVAGAWGWPLTSI